MEVENMASILTYTKKHFDECGKVLGGLDK